MTTVVLPEQKFLTKSMPFFVYVFLRKKTLVKDIQDTEKTLIERGVKENLWRDDTGIRTEKSLRKKS